MQRLACVFIVMATACSGGTGTGAASLTNTQPPVKSAAATPFAGADGAGTTVLGWKIELFSDGPGTDCLSEDATVVGSIGIFSNQPDGSKPQAILQTGDISIVMTSPPTVTGNAAATMGVDGVGMIQGIVTITEFHLTADAMHADQIKGTINAGGTDGGSGEPVALTGDFTAPICLEE
jgi:hypothetical protein